MGEPEKINLVLGGVCTGLVAMAGSYSGVFEKEGFKFDPVEASYRDGKKYGLYWLCFHGARNYLIDKRNGDAYTTVAASCVGAASYGLTPKGPPPARIASVVKGILMTVPMNLVIFNWILMGKEVDHPN